MEHRGPDADGRRKARLAGAAVLLAPLALSGAVSADAATPLAPTLSGLPFAPRSERRVRVRRRGTAIGFRAPSTGTLGVVHTLWRSRVDGCRIALHGDVDGRLGPELAAAALPDGAPGWIATALAADVAEGTPYHLVLSCARGSIPALRDGAADPTRTAWAIERIAPDGVGMRRRPLAPVFAVTYADGTWWGQPYRSARPAVRVCERDHVTATLVLGRAVHATTVRIPGARALPFTIADPAGMIVLRGTTGRHRPHSAPETAATLSAGTAYALDVGGGTGCSRLPVLRSELALGPGLAGIALRDVARTRAGGKPRSLDGTLGLELVGTDGGAAACNGGCGSGGDATGSPGCSDDACHRPPPPTCGDGNIDPGEDCDGTSTGQCPTGCTTECRCEASRSYQSIYTGGYLGFYDPATIPVWPKRLGLMLGNVDSQGPLIAKARQVAQKAGNADARFIFYLSLTTLDSRCNCGEEDFYRSLAASHPEFFLRDGRRQPVSNFVDQYGSARLFVTDIGNPAYVDAWAAFVEQKIDQYGWDGVFADNILRGNFYGYSAVPVNPRTRAPYTTAQYRRDMLGALRRVHDRLAAHGKIIVGNHSNSWEADTFADPVIREQITAMDGVEVEDCVFGYDGTPHSETDWIAQLRYLDFANQKGVRTICNGSSGRIVDPPSRLYLLASYLLTKEGFSNVAELNTLGAWWNGFTTDLGAPRGPYTCLDPAAGFAPSTACPSTGKIYVREWDLGRVLVNPTSGLTATVPLDEELRLDGRPVRSVTLRPRSGVVLLRR
jgi:hypothetical protein